MGDINGDINGTGLNGINILVSLCPTSVKHCYACVTCIGLQRRKLASYEFGGRCSYGAIAMLKCLWLSCYGNVNAIRDRSNIG